MSTETIETKPTRKQSEELDDAIEPASSEVAKDDGPSSIVSPEGEAKKSQVPGDAKASSPDENDQEKVVSSENEKEPAKIDDKISPEETTGSTQEDGAKENQNSTEEETKNDRKDATEESGDKRKAGSSSVDSLPPRPVKRARTAYFIFMDEQRPQVTTLHPGEGIGSIARIMGHKWSAMSAEEKEPYQRTAAEERERVTKALEAWKAAGGQAELEASNTHRDPSALIMPVARIRKICKLDPDVQALSKEALNLITKCAELATAKLGQEAVKVARLQNRRKLLPEDVAHVCSHREQFMFLKDDIKDLAKSLPSADPKSAAKKSETVREAAAVGSKPLTAYFGAPSSNKLS